MLLIGAQSYGGKVNSGFRGLIDHAALWNRALSDAEAARLSGTATVADKRPAHYGEKHRPTCAGCLPTARETAGVALFISRQALH